MTRKYKITSTLRKRSSFGGFSPDTSEDRMLGWFNRKAFENNNYTVLFVWMHFNNLFQIGLPDLVCRGRSGDPKHSVGVHACESEY